MNINTEKVAPTLAEVVQLAVSWRIKNISVVFIL